MIASIAQLPHGGLDTKLGLVLFRCSPLSQQQQERLVAKTISSLMSASPAEIQWGAAALDRDVVGLFDGEALGTLCWWLRDNHPSICTKEVMPRVASFLKRPLSPARQMQATLELIDRLGDVPRLKLEAMAPEVDKMLSLMYDVPLHLACRWLLENHPGVCMAMPRVSEHLLKMVPLASYNEWFQLDTLARIERGALLAAAAEGGS